MVTQSGIEDKIEKAFLRYANGCDMMFAARKEIHEVIALVLGDKVLADYYRERSPRG